MPTYRGQYEDFDGEIFGGWTLIDYEVQYKIYPAEKKTRDYPGCDAEMDVWDLQITSVKDDNYSPVNKDFTEDSKKLFEILSRENMLKHLIGENENV